MKSNVISGTGAERETERASGGRRRFNPKTYNEGIEKERAMFPLGLTKEIRHKDFVEGDLVSLKDGKITPLNLTLPFGGVLDKVGEDKGVYLASVFVRGAVCVRVHGLTGETRQGTKVYASPAGPTQVFSLAEGGCLVGIICAIENLGRGTANVGFHLADDARPFELGGNRPTRLEHSTASARS